MLCLYQNVSSCWSAVAPAVNQQTASTAATGMNPQHGQAGHRCDIAVGAPLNSPVAAAANSTATPQTFNLRLPCDYLYCK
jgi:hypothetical protein